MWCVLIFAAALAVLGGLALSITSGYSRALSDEFEVPQLARLILEHANELVADALALLLRVGDPSVERLQEAAPMRRRE